MNQPKPEIVKHMARLANYIPVPESGCWIWLGGWSERGYGTMNSGDRHNVYAHRFFYENHVGQLLPGMSVCHKCDTPQCVNPAHLFAGTHTDNMADMARKGRTVGPKGERNGNARLTAQDVVGIRNSSESHHEAAARYGVSYNTISDIRLRRKWTHV